MFKGVLNLYSKDLDFYENYIRQLAIDAQNGLLEAIRRFAIHVPKFRLMSDRAIQRSRPTVDDARRIYAREHGFDDWSSFAAFVKAIAPGDRTSQYIEFIHNVEEANIEVVTELLKANPTFVNTVASTQKTPLHSVGSADMARLLLGAEANPEFEYPLSGGTALMHALVWGNDDIADVIGGANLEPKNLRVAAGLGSIELLEQMFDSSGKLTAQACARREYYRPNLGWFPWTSSDCVQEVLDEGLIYAATSGRLAACEFLLDRGAVVDGCAYRTTGLLRATWKNRMEVVEYLLDCGANIDQTADLGGHARAVTPLHIAASDNNLQMVRYLVSRGADLTVRDSIHHSTPLGWAIHTGSEQTRAYIETVS